MTIRDPFRNRLLANLSDDDFALLKPLLVAADLPVRKNLQTRGKPIENIYFIEHGLASIVATGDIEHRIEVGVVGREGATGLSLVMGASKSPYDTFIQSAGSGWRLAANDLHLVTRKSRSLHDQLILFGHTQIVQMAFTVLANGRYSLHQRLARWLLMAQDRADGPVMLTHEFLSVMLGVRRAGVSTALKAMEKKDFISLKRGSIRIENRSGLIELANGSYGVPEDEFDHYFPARVPAHTSNGAAQETATSLRA